MVLYLTYDINELKDGFGAQYLRVVGIYCLAKIIGATYLHTTITEYQHLSNDYWEKIEDHFGLAKFKSKDVSFFENTISIKVPNSLDELKSNNSDEDTLIKIWLAIGILDKTPDYYDLFMDELRNFKKKIDLPEYDKFKKNIAIHIRRGDVNKNATDRYTGNDHYIKVIQALKMKYPYSPIFIFTEDSGDLDAFQKIDNVKLMTDLDVLLTFEYLCNADVLITAKSCFSYLAALYNTSSEIYVENTPTPKLSRWKYVDDLFNEHITESFTGFNDEESVTNNYGFYIFIFMIIAFVFFFCFGFYKKKCIKRFFNIQWNKSFTKGR
jgi:hypothetical protein